MKCVVMGLLAVLAGCPRVDIAHAPATVDAGIAPPPTAIPVAPLVPPPPPIIAAPPAPVPPSAPPPTPRPVPKKRVCNADQRHCCQPDGKIVLASCAPSYPRGVKPGPQRGPGGWCEPCRKKCLPPSTHIASPHGDLLLRDLREGMLVWSLDAQGQRVAVPVTRVSSTRVRDHVILRIALSDGRAITASPEHPTIDGTPLSSLAVNQLLDGARIVSIERAAFEGDEIRDLLPASDTRAYWADGVLLGTTLTP